eukprot:ANDGO_04080.mRNA.1 Nudix hydrolase 14
MQATVIQIGESECEVSVSSGMEGKLRIEDAVSCGMFQSWRDRIGRESRFKVKAIEFQSLDYFGTRVGFLKFKTTTFGPDGTQVPGIVFMRGGAVCILVVLRAQDVEGTPRYSIVTAQPRIPASIFQFPEIPAGMLDDESDAASVARRELLEETGLDATASGGRLVDLYDHFYGSHPSGRIFQGIYPSPGGCDEFLKVFVYEAEMPLQQILQFDGKVTGCTHEGEQITLQVVRYEDLWRLCPEGCVLSTCFLYDKYEQEVRSTKCEGIPPSTTTKTV